MGLRGSSEYLEELLCRVLGDLAREGRVARLADDLYIGGGSIAELRENFRLVLQRFEENNLRLSAEKTSICPTESVILGWVWSQGKIAVSPHKINPLRSCNLPKTVKELRSFIGAFKALSQCVPQYASHLSPLESIAAGQESKTALKW